LCEQLKNIQIKYILSLVVYPLFSYFKLYVLLPLIEPIEFI
jgi:hypothetical protein